MDEWMEPDAADAMGAHADGAEYCGEENLSDAALDDHLWVFAGESVWDLGPAEVDSSADGVVDSLARSVDGQVTVYTDTDSDGQVDRITELDATGDLAVTALDPGTGEWRPTQLGRLD
ncbi:MAG: DUF6802 family protein [Gordonia sp. (in: high G+C Gram-positive bacteria)]|uniref:DUF6802 family protein n=1 Tax=Gordonia sp. (in: high G+C Gram-positive bacteria) TaxID=84139 RepID=UPI003BB6EE4B